ncbi:MAG: hypothetical protein ACK5MI_08405, partial [Mangrovibacterium sp.]
LPADFELIKKKLRQQGNTRRDNMYYISAIKHYLNYKENIDVEGYQNKTIDSIDIKYVNDFLKSFYDKAEILDVIFAPK